MRNDIYNRSFSDPNFIEGQLEMEDTVELFKQQIESVLFTPKTTVMGSIDFGASLDEYVWSFRTSASALKAAITSQINDYCTMALNQPYTIDVNFYRGDVRDICEINIEINGYDRFQVLLG